MRVTIPIATVLLLAVVGCGTVVHENYDETCGDDVDGFVYYESSPYLLVYPDGRGSVTWDIVYLADPTKKRVAKPEAFFAKLNTSMTFENGVLTEAKVLSDSTEIGKALIQVAKVALAGAAFLEKRAEDKEPGLYPEVFKIIVKGPEIELWGVDAEEPVVVRLDEPKRDNPEKKPDSGSGQ